MLFASSPSSQFWRVCNFGSNHLPVPSELTNEWKMGQSCMLLLAGGIDKALLGNHLTKIRAFEMCVNRWNCQFVCKDRGAQTTRATCRTNFTLSNMFFLTTFLSISFFRETESTHIHNCKLFPHNTTSNFST